MNNTYHNQCIRCGKERIVVRTWKEQVGYSTVTNTEMACPDPQCQAQVEKENQKQVDKYQLMKKKSEDRMKKRYANALKKRTEGKNQKN